MATAAPFSPFSPAELAYLTGERLLGRIATVDPDGQPHVVPVGWRYNPETKTIDVSGRTFARTRKFRNARANPLVTFLVDDVRPPWRPRAVMVQGRAEAVDAPADGSAEAMIRITPRTIVSWGLDPEQASEPPSER
jgi:pyridoxamine 5'-phosphate oxidase family protein